MKANDRVADSTVALARPARRRFLAGSAAGALVIAVDMSLPAGLRAETDAPKKVVYAGEGMPYGLRNDPRLFLLIRPNGDVQVTNIRAEMGQGVRTSIAMILADELEADWARVRVVQAEGDEPKYGNQDTDGSRSIRHHVLALRHAGASARRMLVLAAASAWGVPPDEVQASEHRLVHKASNRSAGYGEFASAAAALPLPDVATLKLKQPSEFRYIAKDTMRLIDNRNIVTGRAEYAMDVKIEGMVYAAVAHPAVYGGKVKSVDDSEAVKVPGVLKIVRLAETPIPSVFQPVGGVAVVASNTWAALQGRSKLKVTWDDGPNGGYDSAKYREELQAAARAPGKVVREQGDAPGVLAKAARKVVAEYYNPHLAHATMEIPSAVVKAAEGGAEVWACVQAPQRTRDEVAKALKIKPEVVTVHQTLLGGGFGRKSKPDFVCEAALLSQAMDGKPVKIVWTREDDLATDYYHTVSVERLEAAIDDKGKVTAWKHTSVAPSIGSMMMPKDPGHELPLELGMGFVNTPFDIPNQRYENPEAKAHTRIGWFRAVSNLPHAFAVQSFVAELAAELKRDPKEMLLELLGPDRKISPDQMADAWNYGEDPARYPYETARLRGVIEAVARGAGWGRQLSSGSGLGIAAHRSFASYTAVVAEVQVAADGKVKIPTVDIAIDCGPQVNSERVRSQLEGAVIQGIGNTLHSAITFANGRVQQGNYHQFEVARMNEAPATIRVHMVNDRNWDIPPGGVGEPGLPPVAPAICNAIFAATGKRIRELPVGTQLAAKG